MERHRERTKPVWGRAAVIAFTASLLSLYVGIATNTLYGTAPLWGLLFVMLTGVTLSTISLLKRERRGPAVTIIVLTLLLPLTIFVGALIFFAYFYP